MKLTVPIGANPIISMWGDFFFSKWYWWVINPLNEKGKRIYIFEI
jgi:hypothetical protein